MSRKMLSEATLKDDMKQNWRWNGHTYEDQYHFEIEPGQVYKLYWHGDYITKAHTMNAVKTISTVLLNDKILAG